MTESRFSEELAKAMGLAPLTHRRCRTCKGPVRAMFDAYDCAKCGRMGAGLFSLDPTEPGEPNP